MKMDKIIFTYRLTHDTGFAPCVDNGLLTLACCKGGTENVKKGLRYFIGRFFEENLQKNIEVYISGLYSGKLLYIAKIDKVIPMTEYFSKKEYEDRIDQIYRLDGEKLKTLQSIIKQFFKTKTMRWFTVKILIKKIGVNGFEIVSNKVTNKTENKILELMRDNPNITIQQIMVKTTLSEPGVKKNLKQLKDKKIIKRIGSNKTGYWEVIDKS